MTKCLMLLDKRLPLSMLLSIAGGAVDSVEGSSVDALIAGVIVREIVEELSSTRVTGVCVILESFVGIIADVVDVAWINEFLVDTNGALVERILIGVIKGTVVDGIGAAVGSFVKPIVWKSSHDARDVVEISIGFSLSIL